MCGVPGSGKSTWIANHKNPEDHIISRDAIRFTLLEAFNESNYFAYEDEVFNIFIKNIQSALKEESGDVYVDATHINETSRIKVLKNLDLSNVDLIAVNFCIPLEECLRRNSLRSGLSLVPETAIKNMYAKYKAPRLYEADKIYVYKRIINIKE
jgi:predicted kinase